MPARNAPLTPEFKQLRQGERRRDPRDHAPDAQRPSPSASRTAWRSTTPPEERQAIYEAAWEKGGLQFRATFHDLLVDKAANDTAADFIKRKIREIVKDPATAANLADIDHPYAAKRPPIDTDYFETFNRDNVTLVDVRADADRARSRPAGIRTTRGRSTRWTSSSSPPASTP